MWGVLGFIGNGESARTARLRRISKEGFWIVIGQGAAVLGAVVGVRLMTGLLDPAAYGELALGMTAAMLVNQTILGPLGSGVNRFYAAAQEDGDLCSYLSATRRLLLSATALIGFLAVVASSVLLISGRIRWIPIVLASLAFATLGGYDSILSSIQNAARQRAIVAFHQGIGSWTQYFVAAGLIAWFGSTSTVAMTGFAAATVPVVVSQYLFFRRIVPNELSWASSGGRWRGQIWAFSWPFSTWGIFTWAQLVSDRWALGIFASARDVGLYTALFQLGFYPVSLATGLAIQFLAPILFQRAGSGTDRARNMNANQLSSWLMKLVLGLTLFAFVVTVFLHRLIFETLVAPEYLSVSQYLPWMLLSGGLFAAGQTIALNMMSQLKTRAMIAAKVVTAIVGTLLNLAGAYWYGLAGVVVASNLFSMSVFAWMAVLANSEGGDEGRTELRPQPQRNSVIVELRDDQSLLRFPL